MRRFLLPVLTLAFLGCGTESEPPSPVKTTRQSSEGHRRMLTTLADLATRTNTENKYLGNGLLESMRARLKALGPTGSDFQRWDLLRQVGMLALRYGEERAGIDSLKQSIEVASRRYREIGEVRTIGTVFELGVGFMRLGETENCCARPEAESCILPIRPGGVHSRVEGSEGAAKCFLQIAQRVPETEDIHFESIWLLNVAHMTLGTYPDGVPEKFRIPPERLTAGADFPRFRNAAPRLGIDAFNLSGGAVIDDFTGDGHLDLLTSTWDTSGQILFYRNNGDGTFTDATESSGLVGLFGGLNLVQADYDNDGHLDFLVLRGAWLAQSGQHPNSLVRGYGDGTFEDVTFDAGLGELHAPTQTAAWGDYDLDGDLDLYIGNETTKSHRAACQLFRNNGDGKFTDVAASAGVENFGYTKGVVWGDYNGDRYPDLYVSNYQGQNRLYRNDKNGAFTDVAQEVGVVGPRESFPVWFWDFDNDGHLDLFVPNYSGRVARVAKHYMGLPAEYEPAKLYRGDGKGGFTDVAESLGLIHPMLPMGANFGDLDGDGLLDFYLGTGDPLYWSLMPNLMFVQRNGKFVDVTSTGGFGHLQKGHGVSFADFDSDGDIDVFEQMGGAYRGDAFNNILFENPGFGHRWVRLRLVGTKTNRCAIGARIDVEIEEAGATRHVQRTVTSGGTFGANPLIQTIGLGKASAIASLTIHWPVTGASNRFERIPLDRSFVITEGSEQPVEGR